MKRKAIFPGTFDPITLGHLNLIHQAVPLFDEIMVAVADETNKQTLFTFSERIQLIASATQDLPHVSVKGYKGLTADFYREEGACALLRGVRSSTDFDYEKQLAYANQALHQSLQTLFLIPILPLSYVTSSMVRAIARLQGDVSQWVPEEVAKALAKKYP